jgi:drug/metabolite transporter (DMT)-like permease
MLSGSLSFAVMSALAHAAGDYCDWRLVALVRSGLCVVLVGAWAMAGGVSLVLFRPGVLWLRSLAGSLSLVCTFYALPRLPISDVLTVTNVFPVWVALLSWPLLGERPGWHVLVAVACGVIGVALIQQPHFAEGNFASLVALASSVSTALAMIGLHRLKGIDPRAIVVHFSAVSMLFVLATFVLFDGDPDKLHIVDARAALVLAGVGLAASVGQVFLTKAFAAGPPARISVVGLSQVMFAMLLDLALLKRDVNVVSLAGAALVLAPSAWLMLYLPEGARGPEQADT